MSTTKISTIKKHITAELSDCYHSREAESIAALIIENLFSIPGTWQLLNKQVTVTEEIDDKIRRMVRQLLRHEPVQYVLGYTEFYGRRFKTDARALIPRPETEELVHFVLSHRIPENSKILDIGTGSGCIAITLALESGAKVYALDVEGGSLELARENAASLQASIRFLQADFLNDRLELSALDVIVCNPPYVPESDRQSLDQRVKDYEPSTALFVPDQKSLIFYERIAQMAPVYLKPGGQIFLEIYHKAGPAVSKLFRGAKWSQVLVKKDLQGKDRMLKACLTV